MLNLAVKKYLPHSGFQFRIMAGDIAGAGRSRIITGYWKILRAAPLLLYYNI